MLVGAGLAIVLVCMLALGGILYAQSTGRLADTSKQDRVVLIFESPAQDGATVAALISIVADGRIDDVSPDTSATVPGTSSKRLGDAYVFGGGAAVAKALGAPDAGGPTAFVSVPAATWHKAVEATSGVTVNVPQKLTVFDGTQLITVQPGEQKLSVAQVTALLNGLTYFSPDQASALRRELALRLSAALVAAHPAKVLVQTDLSAQMLERWLQDVLARTKTS